MSGEREQRVRSYLELISPADFGGDLVEAVLGGIEAGAGEGVLELAGGPPGRAVPEQNLELARIGLGSLALGNDVASDQLASIEAIIIPSLRPVYDVVDGAFRATAAGGSVTPGHALWAKLSDDAALRQRIEAALPAIGRIELPGRTDIPYGGTGFVVGANLLMTNRHVAAIFAAGIGDRRVRFLPGQGAGVDFRRDADPGRVFGVRTIRMIHPYWDMAILEVDGLPGEILPLKLSLANARDLQRSEVAVVGYPAFDSRNPADVQSDLFHGRYGIKRLQPGLLQGGHPTESFGKVVPAATHDCSTLGGNSGSALISLDTGEIVGLHFAGRYLERNYAVPSSELSRDSRVVDAGVNFGGPAPGGGNDWGDWWRRADAVDAPETAAAAQHGGTAASPLAAAGGAAASPPAAAVTVEIPLRITVGLGAAGSPDIAIRAAAEAVVPQVEAPGAGVVPRSAADYDGRRGYDPAFLSGGEGFPGVSVPMPDAADPDVLAPLKAGGTRLDYQNFSLKMHAQRRLAMISASNVTEEPALREPEPGRNYSRRGLFNERWFPDLRLDDRYQLPQIFYTDDSGAFDRGHIVRRDDVAWGRTFDHLLKGNVDSFHVTNCSPQVAGFNRSDSGDDNWGDLENHVLSEAASERLSVFGGPVLSDGDPVFVGRGLGGATIRAHIPQAFWKVIVAQVGDGIAAYGFVIEQDLSGVPLEFAVAEAFVRSMRPLSEIERLTGVVFAEAVRQADQAATVRGREIAMRAGVRPAAASEGAARSERTR